ncbi:phosphonate ABC transporter, permease protein PhnE [Varunaivibrio sulfuroxidans]|uniref:Phosphonate transport system permease protein n=1 Tax=Varunaivibrio sulfuroxidans TaxID=1773489 RepID=A0A4R3JEP4_9PROT|nr:phosphonate ABC transporter, permease protein PhnE [Varunaivibrio sulfuroxidans]TCS64284.1 phosphonate transport system permease protein [Varunaivibrio sulfuroxidans]WES31278.1 phosphonate ABC transporter, permease protein PhnE [Varunaivibrio sulfuroxidans]
MNTIPALADAPHTPNGHQVISDGGPSRTLRLVLGFGALIAFIQSLFVIEAKPEDLISGAAGMADMISRAMPPAVDQLPSAMWPALETIDIAIFGTFAGVFLAVPLAVLAAGNVSPARPLYYLSRAVIALCRSVPDLVWALLFVAAVGLGPFPGALAISIHSVGMLGRLFSEVIEDMDMGPVDALTLTGATRMQVFTHAVLPSVLPSVLGISLYRLDENIRSSLVLGFVGAGGIGFQLLTAMNLFQYKTVSVLLIVTFVMVMLAERFSAYLRRVIA